MGARTTSPAAWVAPIAAALLKSVEGMLEVGRLLAERGEVQSREDFLQKLEDVSRNFWLEQMSGLPLSAGDRGPAIRSATLADADPSDNKAILRKLEADYACDRNPIHPWEAFAIARGAGIDLPDWLLAYFDEGADRILKIRNEVARGTCVKREAERVGKALAFGADGRGRGKGRLSRAAQLERDRALYLEVVIMLNAGTKLYLAWYAVAQARHISPPTVRRAYRRIKNESDR
jgi:hypothetical protein